MCRRLLATTGVALMITSGFALAAPAPALAAPAPALAAPTAPAISGLVPPTRVAPSEMILFVSNRPAKVTVPLEYVYNPKLGSLHDYCTTSPDELPAPQAINADFRGPCARHDLCYLGKKDRKACDEALRRDLLSNCESSYGQFNPLRATCQGVAVIYWVAVVVT
jgi:hypothetical protein